MLSQLQLMLHMFLHAVIPFIQTISVKLRQIETDVTVRQCSLNLWRSTVLDENR